MENYLKRLSTLLLALALAVTFMPFSVYADDYQQGDEEYYEDDYEWYEFESDVDYVYSDGDLQLALPHEASIPDEADFTLHVGVQNEDYEDDADRWVTLFTEGKEYKFDKSTGILTLYGSEIAKIVHVEGEEGCLISIEAEQDGENSWIAEGWCYFYNVYENYIKCRDYNLLRGTIYTIDKSDAEVYISNSEYPHGIYFNYELTGVSSSDEDIASVETADDGWEICGVSNGTATITVNYLKLDGTPDKYTFNITVVDERYELYVNTANFSGSALPGDTVELTADAVRSYIDKNGEVTEEEISGSDISWELISDRDIATLAADGKSGEVRFRTHDEIASFYEDGFVVDNVKVRATIKDTGISDEVYVDVTDEYMDLSPRSFDIQPGESATEKFEFLKYTYNNQPEAIPSYFTFNFDEEAFRITDSNGKTVSDGETADDDTFTITRLNNWDSEITVYAAYGDEETYEKTYYFSPVEYNIFIDGDDYAEIYSDADSAGMTFDLSDLGENWQSQYDLKFRVGYRDWDDEKEEDVWSDELSESAGDYEVKYSDGKAAVTLTKNGISKAKKDENLTIEAAAYLKNGGSEAARANGDIYIMDAKKEYYYDEGRDILTGSNGWINGNFYVHVENTKYPEGEDFNCNITDVKIVSGADLITNLEKNTDEYDTSWSFDTIQGKTGTVKLRVYYTDIDGKTASYIYTAVIKDEVFGIDLRNTDGMWELLPGQEVNLKADPWHEYRDSEGNYHEDKEVALKWEIVSGAEHATLTVDSADNTKAVIKALAPSGQSGGFGEEITVRVSAKADSDAYDEMNLFWTDRYTIICSDNIDTDLDTGSTLENVRFEVRDYNYYGSAGEGYNDQHYRTIENPEFSFDYDEEELEVTDGSEPGTYNIKKLSNSWGTLDVSAEWEVDEDSDSAGTNFEFNHFYNVELMSDGLPELPDYQKADFDFALTGFDNLLKTDADNLDFDFHIVTSNPGGNYYDPDSIVYLDDALAGATFSEDGSKVTIAIDADKIPDKAADPVTGEEFSVDRVSISTDVTRKSGADEYSLYSDEGAGNTIIIKSRYYAYLADRLLEIAKEAQAEAEAAKGSAEGVEKAEEAQKIASIAAEAAQNAKNAAAEAVESAKATGDQSKIDAASRTSSAADARLSEANAAVKTADKTLADAREAVKAANKIKVKVLKVTAKAKKKTTIKAKKAFKVTGAAGKVTYKKVKGNKKITVAKNGKITIKKGLKKGTYKIRVKVTAAGNAKTKAGSKTVTLKIKLK